MVCLLLFIPILTACGDNRADAEITEGNDVSNLLEQSGFGEDIPLEPLIFNTPEVESEANISPVGHDFYLPISDEQLSTIFPVLDITDYEWNRSNAYYSIDGTLAEVSARIHLSNDMAHWLEVQVGFGQAPMTLHEYLFSDSVVFQYSDVHGVLVRVLMIDEGWSDPQFSFDASFVIDDIYYRIRFRDSKESGQNRMTEIVNGLILNGSEGFVVLENPVIPYIRSEAITLDEAHLDMDFGAFVPVFIPDEFNFQNGHRNVREYASENSLYLEWQMSYDESYLYDIYTHWIDERTTDTPVYPFNEIFWLDNRLGWHISTVREHDLERLISADEFRINEFIEPWHQPIFLAEELTLDILRWHEEISINLPQGADWDENEEMENVFLPVETSWIQLHILFGDVLLRVHTGQGNIPPEAIWAMLEDLLE